MYPVYPCLTSLCTYSSLKPTEYIIGGNPFDLFIVSSLLLRLAANTVDRVGCLKYCLAMSTCHKYCPAKPHRYNYCSIGMILFCFHITHFMVPSVSTYTSFFKLLVVQYRRVGEVILKDVIIIQCYGYHMQRHWYLCELQFLYPSFVLPSIQQYCAPLLCKVYSSHRKWTHTLKVNDFV